MITKIKANVFETWTKSLRDLHVCGIELFACCWPNQVGRVSNGKEFDVLECAEKSAPLRSVRPVSIALSANLALSKYQQCCYK